MIEIWSKTMLFVPPVDPEDVVRLVTYGLTTTIKNKKTTAHKLLSPRGRAARGVAASWVVGRSLTLGIIVISRAK